MSTPETLHCGHPASERVSSCDTGYAILPGRPQRRICYDCAAERDRAQARTGQPISAYLTRGSDGKLSITTWPGRVLGPVTSASVTLPRWLGSRHMPASYHVRASIGGRTYYGRSQGPGMCINLRAIKGSK